MYRVILLSLALLLASNARAEVVEGLYAATVPVADQGQASLAAGASQALSEVVVKVSGSESALRDPAVAAALGEARAQVQQFVFGRDPGPEGGLVARFEFSGDYVTDLLRRAGLPIWSANRPRVLVWAVYESGGIRNFISPAETPELAEQLKKAFQHRGVPLMFPLFDLGDATALPVEAAWQQQSLGAESASARYGVEDILLGRVVESSAGTWIGDWSYLHRGERSDRSGDAADAGEFFANGADLVAADMVARYAVAASGPSLSQLVMGVRGVDNYSDYATLVSWLESLELVQRASVERIEGDRLEIVLSAALDPPRLAQLMQLNRRLQPLPPEAGELEYQWQN